MLNNITSKEIELKPDFLLNILLPELQKEEKHIIVNVNTVARILYAFHWKEIKIPSRQEFINKIYKLVEMEKIL